MLPIAGLALVTAAAIRHSFAVAAETGDAARLAHRIAARRLGSGLASIVPLQAEREWKKYLGGVFENYAGAEAATLRQRRSLAALNVVVGAAGPIAALCVLAVAWHAGSRGGDLLVPAFIAFCWLALGESAQGVPRIVEGKARERAAQKGLAEWTGDDRHSDETLAESTPHLRELHVRGLPNQAPDGRLLGEAISLSLRAAFPTALTGSSGSGKTTLLKRIAGWIEDDDCFLTEGKALSSARRLRLTHVCLHDAAVLSDTFRENFFAPGVPDALLWEALKAVELDERVTLAGGLGAWIGQDALSLGEAQRLNLARAFLTDRPIVLLDEPTEHIGAAQAARILPRLLSRLSDRIVLYATHDRAAASEGVQLAL